jgi:hypothetical protein
MTAGYTKGGGRKSGVRRDKGMSLIRVLGSYAHVNTKAYAF